MKTYDDEGAKNQRFMKSIETHDDEGYLMETDV